MPKLPYFRVLYKLLKNDYGFANLGTNTIEVDRRIKGKKQLEIILHECLHMLNPKMPEAEIVRQSIKLTHTLWRQGYRKVDVERGPTPLQDMSI